MLLFFCGSVYNINITETVFSNYTKYNNCINSNYNGHQVKEVIQKEKRLGYVLVRMSRSIRTYLKDLSSNYIQDFYMNNYRPYTIHEIKQDNRQKQSLGYKS